MSWLPFNRKQKLKEKRKGRSQPASKVMSCLVLFAIVPFIVIFALIRARIAPRPLPTSKVLVVPTSQQIPTVPPVTNTTVLLLPSATTTPAVPVATPAPTITITPSTVLPVSASDGFIEYYRADQTVIPAGGCVTFTWSVVNAAKVTTFATNWPADVQPMVAENPGTAKYCPSAAGGYVPGEPVDYTLTAYYPDGRNEQRTFTITYESPSAATPTTIPTFISQSRPNPSPGSSDAGPITIHFPADGAEFTEHKLPPMSFSLGPQAIDSRIFVTGENGFCIQLNPFLSCGSAPITQNPDGSIFLPSGRYQ
jgi:hypothetical protein